LSFPLVLNRSLQERAINAGSSDACPSPTNTRSPRARIPLKPGHVNINFRSALHFASPRPANLKSVMVFLQSRLTTCRLLALLLRDHVRPHAKYRPGGRRLPEHYAGPRHHEIHPPWLREVCTAALGKDECTRHKSILQSSFCCIIRSTGRSLSARILCSLGTRFCAPLRMRCPWRSVQSWCSGPTTCWL
jgi:hypothetical protein